MNILQTPLDGLFVIEAVPRTDDRGSFARLFAAEGFEEAGLQTQFVHMNHSINAAAGTLRGLHWQRAPHAEVKLVRCSAGVVFDVAVDIREGSPTRYRWFGIELHAGDLNQLYVPEGFAHGYQALEADSEVSYLSSTGYAPVAEDGLRWDDPAIGIIWPLTDCASVSDKDASWPLIDSQHASGDSLAL